MKPTDPNAPTSSGAVDADASAKSEPVEGTATSADGHAGDHAGPPASAHEIARRQLLGRMSLGIGVVAAAAVSAPGIGFVAAPLFRKAPQEWRSVGKIAAFKMGETVTVVFVDASPLPWAGVTAKTAAWLRRTGEDTFEAFAVNCAHLGCPVRWVPDAKLFMCPCHGGVYYEDGTVAAGPPPHGLTRYPVRLREDEVEIQTGAIPIG